MKFDSTPFIVDRNTKIVFDRCKYVARSFFFFRIDRSLKRQTREECSGSWPLSIVAHRVEQ